MERFGGGKVGEMECGCYGVGDNDSLQIFTSSCDKEFRPLCVLESMDI